METTIPQLLHDLGNQWLSLLVVALWLAHQLGLFRAIGRLFAAGGRVRLDERQLLSSDQQELFTGMRNEIDDLRRWRREDRDECAARMKALEEQCAAEAKEFREQIASLIKDAKGWRHLVAALAMYIAALRKKLRDHDIELVPFDGWRKFIEEGGDPSVALEDDMQ